MKGSTPNIQRIRLLNYKAFADFSASFGHVALLVGPNSAGKSTVIEALRGASAMLRHARHFRATSLIDHGNEQHWVHPFRFGQLAIEADNLRHEFRSVDSSLKVSFAGGASLEALWPKDEAGGFFLLRRMGSAQTRYPEDVRQSFPQIGLVPLLTPLDRNEELLNPNWVLKNIDGRLSSRHFRNQLALLVSEGGEADSGWESFREFCVKWLPEIRMDPPTRRDAELDVLYRDPMGGAAKEIVWAGDGIQVFAQILVHLFRLRHSDVIVLDEPDVYLHADLQRRLIRLLDSLGPQVILATHSAEMLAEADPEGVVWMDKTRPHAVRAPDPAQLSGLSVAIGTAFNLPLARVLRARLALFLEGDDVRFLRHLGHTLGTERLVAESNLAVVPLIGGSNWRRLEGFTWLVHELLKDTVQGQVILDRDFHSAEAIADLTSAVSGYGLQLHVWERHELESYLLHSAAIARISGADPDWLDAQLAEISAGMYGLFLTQMIATRYADGLDRGIALTTVGKACETEMQEFWTDPAKRVARCPAKELLSALNDKLTQRGFDTISFARLARTVRSTELPSEFCELLRRIDRKLR